MGVVSHGYGGGRDGSGGWYACGTRPTGFGRMSGDARALPEHEVIH